MPQLEVFPRNAARLYVDPNVRVRPSARWVLVALGTLIVVSATGCREDPTIWSAQTQSPDGSWLAYAHTVQHSGMGTDGVETIVELRRRTGLRSSTRILGFADDGSSMGLKMNWVTPSHLEVLFRDDTKVLYYQVVKTSGVEISVRNVGEALNSEDSTSTRSK